MQKDLEVNSIGWSVLRFHWMPKGFLTGAWFNGAYNSLNTQRPDQTWVNKLLPSPYHAKFTRRTADPLYGGLNGDLSILVGLLGFSCYDGAVTDVLEYSIRGVQNPDGGWRMHNQHEEEGWVDRRGFLVHIWSWPPYSTSAQLYSLERGNTERSGRSIRPQRIPGRKL